MHGLGMHRYTKSVQKVQLEPETFSLCTLFKHLYTSHLANCYIVTTFSTHHKLSFSYLTSARTVALLKKGVVKDQCILVSYGKVLSLFLAGTVEPFTVHETASWEALAPISCQLPSLELPLCSYVWRICLACCFPSLDCFNMHALQVLSHGYDNRTPTIYTPQAPRLAL